MSAPASDDQTAAASATDMQALNRQVPEGMSESVRRKWELLTRHLHSWIDHDKIREALERQERDPSQPLKIYWGTAITGTPHLGYMVPMGKVADFLAAGCDVTILFADLHGFLDNMKCGSWEQLAVRCEAYKVIIKGLLRTLGVDLSRLHFVQGNSYQLTPKYVEDMFRMCASVTANHCQNAGAEVVKQSAHPKMSNLLYPILQALDEEYLHVDVQFGGVDQRKIFMFAREKMPLVGYEKRAYLMNPLVPGLGQSGKMSSSEPLSKVDFYDSPQAVAKKIRKAYSVDRQPAGNGLLAIARYIVFPRLLEPRERKFDVPRPDKYGGPVAFDTYEQLESAFEAGDIVSGDLKAALTDMVGELIAPMRELLLEHRDLMLGAYPDSTEMKALYGVAVEKKKAAAAAEAGNSKKAAKKGGGGGGAAAAKNTACDVSRLRLVVGRIVECDVHPDADTLYVEKIDVGESAPLQVVSGLAKHVPLDEMRGRLVVLLTNLKSSKLRGVDSHGMVMCACHGDKVEVLAVPDGAKPGDRIASDAYPGEPDAQINTKNKNNVWNGANCPTPISADLRLNAEGAACYRDSVLTVGEAGAVHAPTLKEGAVQ